MKVKQYNPNWLLIKKQLIILTLKEFINPNAWDHSNVNYLKYSFIILDNIDKLVEIVSSEADCIQVAAYKKIVILYKVNFYKYLYVYTYTHTLECVLVIFKLC